MTLKKLAQLASVSVSVASKAFSGSEDVSDAMREHVFAVARANGCFQQFYHAPYDRPVVAVIIPEVISEYYVHYMQALRRGIEESGCTMLLSISNFDDEMKAELVRYYTEYSKVDALVVFGAMPEGVSAPSTVLASISKGESGADITVGSSLDEGLAEAIDVLLQKGHRRIAYVGEAFTEGKGAMMRALFTERGLDLPSPYYICSRERFEAAGRDGVARLWALPERPTAIIGAYGYITRGILSALEARGASVPRDVAVVSMDSDPAPLYPSLDVACIPSGIEGVAEALVKLLLERLHGKKQKAPEVLLLPTMFYKGNTI